MAYPQRPFDPPEHWDSYRPAYNGQQQGPPTRPPAGFEQQVRNTPAFSRSPGPGPVLPDALPTLDCNDLNPNRIPIVPRKRNRTPTPQPKPPPTIATGPANNGPQLWPTTLDDLMGQTTRAYDLVLHYAHDCPDGSRWTTASIKRIHETGKELHDAVRTLTSWKRQVAELGAADRHTMRKIREDVVEVVHLCNKVKDAIAEEEYVPVYQRKYTPETRSDEALRTVGKSTASRSQRRKTPRAHDTWRPDDRAYSQRAWSDRSG